MKKLLLSAVAVLGLLPGLTSTVSAELVAENRSDWTINGCSNETEEGAGLGTLDAMKDGILSTFWHSVWSNNIDHTAQNHYFVVDRGEALAETALSAVGYTPRQDGNSGNGYVTACDVYILDSVDGLNLWEDSSQAGLCSGGHNIDTFISENALTPTAQGTFPYSYGDTSNRGESKVTFAPTAGRYILFVATATSGSRGDYFANCAEFNAYTEEEEVDLSQKIQLPGSGLVGVTELVNGQEYLIYDTFSGRNGFHYVESGNTSQVKKNPIGLDATDLLDLSYVWVAEEVEGGWKFVNKDCEQYIKPLTWWNNDGVDGTGGIFEVTYNNDSESTFTIKNTTSDGYYWSGDFTYLAGDAETGKHPFMFIEAAPLYPGSVPVTLTYPAVGEFTGTVTIDVAVGNSIERLVPVPNFFTKSGIAEEDKVVSGTNNKFTVEGTWALPFEPDHVYRIDIRQNDANVGSSNLLYEASTKKVNTRNKTNQDEFVPERLFYLAGKGLDETTGNLIVTLHSIAADAATGFQVAVGDNSVGAFSETPTEFRVVTNSNGTGISLQHPESNQAHVNDLSDGLGIWNNVNSQNDNGSFLRFFALEDSDFDGLMEGDLAAFITQEMLDAAKASKSAADVRSLFEASAPYLAAVAEAEALLASISGYTAEHFGEGLGYFSGTTYEAIFALAEALQETLEGVDVEAITAATEALAAEVAKVQVNVPVAGKFYRIQNYAADAYLVGGAEVMIAKFESVDAGAPNSIFYFTGDKLVSYTTGLYLANFDRDNNGKMFLGYTNVNGAEVGTSLTFKVASPGKFNVVYNGDRYLYSAGAGNVNAGSNVTTSSTGYQNYCFTLTEVEWLPIAIDEEFGWTTLYSPVQLGFNDRVKAYVGTVNADDPSDLKFVVTELTEAIPANVGVLVQLLEGAQVDNGCVYLPVEESTVTGVTSDLTGSFEKVAVASEVQVADASEIVKSHFVFEKKSDELNGDFGEFNKNDVDDLAAFAAHLEVDNASDETITIADSEGNNPTGIEEIAVESEKVQGIYDLQGRRLSAPVKGINIINGKKVLVK